MSKSLTRRRTTSMILVGLILLALIPFAIQQAGKDEDERSSRNSKKTIYQGSASSHNSSTRRSSRKTSKKLPPSHQTEDLKSFFLPPSQQINVTLEEALDHLFSQYREICQESGEIPISFRYKIEGTAEPIIFAKIEGDFLANLKYLAAMAGTTLEIDDHKLLFTEIEDGPIVQRRWTLPPTFSSWLPRLPEISSQVDPFDGITTPPPSSTKTLLQNIDLIGDEGSVSFLKSSSTMIVRAGNKSLQRIDGLVEKVASNKPIQTRLRFFEEENPLIVALIPGSIVPIERSNTSLTDGPNMQVLVTSVEQGFGRKIQTVSFSGEGPTEGAQALYLQSGNIADLGISENLTFATYNLTRAEEGEPQILSFKDENGTLHEKPFIAERIDATGRAVSIPKFGDE